MSMTPAQTDSPLRRSEVGQFRDGAITASAVVANDDDEERRQARRRTLMRPSDASETASVFEENETLKKCLEIYNTNKLCKENAWSVSLIDTLSTLLDRHHKSLNNFKVAGSSLEASSKVYSLRVDCIHRDVLRMSAGLNAKKFSERNMAGDDDDDDDDGVATGGDGAADPGSPAAGATEAAATAKATQKKTKRPRKAVSTITKNKETLNARLDTVPMQDPVFGKLNSIVGSINASNRLMNNILLTKDSELMLRTDFRFWDSTELKQYNYTEKVPLPPYQEGVEPEEGMRWLPCGGLLNIPNFADLKLRPLFTGYVISDTPEAIADDRDATQLRRNSFDDDNDDGGRDFDDGGSAVPPSQSQNVFHTSKELAMAFDMNAECEPLPPMNEPSALIEVDYNELDDLTTDERTAINRCRGLRRTAVLIEDLRPVDASSRLEYSYRPLDKISQFWAGPSHWKFKRARPRSTMAAAGESATTTQARGATARARRTAQLAKKRSKQLDFTEFHDELFIKLDNKYKMRKVNIQKKWDPRKLKLPTDLQMDVHMFGVFKFAPALVADVGGIGGSAHATAEDGGGGADAVNVDRLQDMDGFAGNALVGGGGEGGVDGMLSNAAGGVVPAASDDDDGGGHFADDDDGGLALSGADHHGGGPDSAGVAGEDCANNTVLEIPTEFEGAPAQVTKIIVPFAKRAKVIDMKSLKRCCTQLFAQQMKRPVAEEAIPKLPIPKSEAYSAGMASFQELYKRLPDLLNRAMTEALTPSVALYSVLHLANDYSLRLIPQEDMEDFTIRQIIDGLTASSAAAPMATVTASQSFAASQT